MGRRNELDVSVAHYARAHCILVFDVIVFSGMSFSGIFPLFTVIGCLRVLQKSEREGLFFLVWDGATL